MNFHSFAMICQSCVFFFKFFSVSYSWFFAVWFFRSTKVMNVSILFKSFFQSRESEFPFNIFVEIIADGFFFILIWKFTDGTIENEWSNVFKWSQWFFRHFTTFSSYCLTATSIMISCLIIQKRSKITEWWIKNVIINAAKFSIWKSIFILK